MFSHINKLQSDDGGSDFAVPSSGIATEKLPQVLQLLTLYTNSHSYLSLTNTANDKQDTNCTYH